MSIENEFVFIGWNTEGTSDKIWGYFLRPGHAGTPSRWAPPNYGRHCCIFWGRRGKAMKFKARGKLSNDQPSRPPTGENADSPDKREGHNRYDHPLANSRCWGNR